MVCLPETPLMGTILERRLLQLLREKGKKGKRVPDSLSTIKTKAHISSLLMIF